VDGLAPGGATKVGSVTLPAADGELQLRLAAHRSFVRLWVVDPAQPGPVRVLGSQELKDVFNQRGWLSNEGRVLVVAEDNLDAEGAKSIEKRVREGERIVVLAQSKHVPFFGAPEPIPQTWGPTPFCFTGKDVWTLPGRTILGHEIFQCAPLEAIPEVKGIIGVLVPPPIRRWGALVIAQTVGKGRIVVCHLRIQKGLLAGNGFDIALLAELTDRALEDSP
jgi:hypothetical protein